MEQIKKVTLSDIAERLNISVVTVSKALSNKEGVGEDLRKQIKTLAAELGYKQKKAGQNSSGSSITGNIGILIPNRFFFSELFILLVSLQLCINRIIKP